MEGEVKGKTFKMKGHTLPGINQRLDAKATNVAEQGLAGSSAFQDRITNMTGMDKEQQAAATAHNDAHEQGRDPHGSSAFKQFAGVGAALTRGAGSVFGGGGAGNAAQAMQQANPLPNVPPPIMSKPSMAKDYREGFEAYPSMRKIKK